jgi:hypothetical protein
MAATTLASGAAATTKQIIDLAAQAIKSLLTQARRRQAGITKSLMDKLRTPEPNPRSNSRPLGETRSRS